METVRKLIDGLERLDSWHLLLMKKSNTKKLLKWKEVSYLRWGFLIINTIAASWFFYFYFFDNLGTYSTMKIPGKLHWILLNRTKLHICLLRRRSSWRFWNWRKNRVSKSSRRKKDATFEPFYHFLESIHYALFIVFYWNIFHFSPFSVLVWQGLIDKLVEICNL